MPRPLAPHGTANRWRTGCGCDECYGAHLDDLFLWRRKKADLRFPAPIRNEVLRLIRQGYRPVEAARRVGIHVQTVYARSRIDPAWQGRLDGALMAGRRPDVPHGTPTGYRHFWCVCPECRAAHHKPKE
ncbi:hypothetical protein Strop_0507 [Salinispora tropica CNB-440]|uniref:Uncharacterized protein n=1 Tax=Salinispora tropica (strain ATCC BAA-916 / DSM 44818 / JCM 13857 / NBRC 105044 / CNB-440) TaxID=369723 RepID=A4X291_SALTO|nr:hypothetical protein Strop_0507 [Salinispora tropica CNB-440]